MKEKLQQLKKWFSQYVADFYGNDDLVNTNIKLKEDHTERVRKKILIIAQGQNLDPEQKLIAETIALLHDIGRFKQFKDYRTYTDAKSVNHTALGLKIINQKKLLEDIDPAKKKLIESAIALHGIEKLPPGLDEQTELFAKLIRDADKLDIYQVMLEHVDPVRDDPRKYMESMGFVDSRKISPEVAEAITSGKTINYQKLKTLDDMIAAQMGWVVSDINFTATLREIKKQKYIQQVSALLTPGPAAEKISNYILTVLDKRTK